MTPGAVERRTVVVLGASNVARGLGAAFTAARTVAGGPVDFLFAAGHGRSYGQENSFFGRVLPGIRDCGLWQALDGLARSPAARPIGLVTDVGNDIVYGASPETIEGWVATCLERLAAVDARLIVARLPLAALARVGPLRFQLVRSLLFPRSDLDLQAALRLARETDERLESLARRFGAASAEPPREWYGFDPIHIRAGAVRRAWSALFDAARDEGAEALRIGFFDGWLAQRRLRRTRPLQMIRREREERCEQPSLALRDGSRAWSF